jgi:hypothetical protein
MYIPDDNQMNNQAEIVDFMKRFSFALIITSKDNVPTATHLPFLVRVEDDEIALTSHFAKENPQWKDLLGFNSFQRTTCLYFTQTIRQNVKCTNVELPRSTCLRKSQNHF